MSIKWCEIIVVFAKVQQLTPVAASLKSIAFYYLMMTLNTDVIFEFGFTALFGVIEPSVIVVSDSDDYLLTCKAFYYFILLLVH